MVRLRRLLRLPLGPAVAAALIAATLAAVVLALDGAIDVGLDVPAANARALSGSSIGALVTIGAFTFWMRPLAAQMATSNLPSPILAGRLHDGFQRMTVSATVGALTYHSIVLYALPVQGPSPAIATLVGAVVTVGSIVGLLIGMQRAERSTRPGRALAAARAVVADNREHVTSAASAAGSGRGEEPVVPGGPGQVALSTASGWVHDLDLPRMAAAVPEGSTIRLDVSLGTFATAGWTTLATVWVPSDSTAPQLDEIAAAIAISDERPAIGDLRGSLVDLVDVAVHAALGGSSSPSIVFDAVWHLGGALHEILDCELPGPGRRFDGDRSVVLAEPADHATIIEPAVQRVRRTAARDPTTAIELLLVLSQVRDHAIAAGRDGAGDVLEREMDLCVAQCRRSDVLPEDLARVEAVRRSADRGRDRPLPDGSRRTDHRSTPPVDRAAGATTGP